MRKLIWLSLLGTAFAQTTTTGTIVDPNGNPYASGTASAYSVANSGQVTTSTSPVTTNGSGLFSMTLNAGTYIFTVCAPPVLLGQPTTNPTPKQICFTSQPIAISGGSQDVSATLNGIAASLGPHRGEFDLYTPVSGTKTIAGNLQVGTGTGGTITDALINGSNFYYAVDSGAVNAYVINPTPTAISLTIGMHASFVTSNANTGASTINVSGLGIKNITKNGTTAIASGDIPANKLNEIEYDGTEWQLLNVGGSGSGTVSANNDHASAVALYAAAGGSTTVHAQTGTDTSVFLNGSCTNTAWNFLADAANTGFVAASTDSFVWCYNGSQFFEFRGSATGNEGPTVRGGNGGYCFSANGTLANGVVKECVSAPADSVLSADSTANGDGKSKFIAAGFQSGGTTFTASGCANSTLVGGATAGTYTSVTAGSCTVTITMGNTLTAAHGWVCDAHDVTTVADANNVTMGSTTTTTANLVEGTIAANDVIAFKCTGY